MKFSKILPWALVAILCLLLTFSLIDRPRSNRSSPLRMPGGNFQEARGQVLDSSVSQNSPGFIDRAMDNVSQATRTVKEKFSSLLAGPDRAPTEVPGGATPAPALTGDPPLYDPQAMAENPNRDSDNDGLKDRIEVVLGTNPASPDTNNNGIPDFKDPQSYERVAIDGESIGGNTSTDIDAMIDKWIARAEKIAAIVLAFKQRPGGPVDDLAVPFGAEQGPGYPTVPIPDVIGSDVGADVVSTIAEEQTTGQELNGAREEIPQVKFTEFLNRYLGLRTKLQELLRSLRQ